MWSARGRLSALVLMLCVATFSARVSASPHHGHRHGHRRGSRLGEVSLAEPREAASLGVDGVFWSGPAYEGCCDGEGAVVLDCCHSGGCCPTVVQGGDGETVFLECCAHESGSLDTNAARSDVTFHGPSYGGCCEGDGERMACCAAGGCCPETSSGERLDCCAVRSTLSDSSRASSSSSAAAARLGAAALSTTTARLGDATGSNPTVDAAVAASGKSEGSGARPGVTHDVDPEVSFAPAEEADANDPVYGTFATVEPGGEGYYAQDIAPAEDQAADAAEAAREAEEAAAALRVVAAEANDDATDPAETAPGSGSDASTSTTASNEVATATAAAAGEGGVALLEDETEGGALHTKTWWDRHYGGKGNAAGMTFRAFALQVAAGLVVVVWLTALIVGAVLKRSDGRSEEHRALLV